MSSTLNETATNIYNEAAADLGDLIHAWTAFQRLVRNESIVDILNRASPHFFGAVGAALRTYSVTLAAKLLEPPVVAGKRTASLEALLNVSALDESPCRDLLRQVKKIRLTAETVIEYRHKRVVHTDYAIRAEKTDSRSPSSAEFQDVVHGLRDFMERFEKAARLQLIPYENSNGTRDVDEVVRLTASLPSC